MDEVERCMKEQNYAITHEAIFKYYLAFLESCEQPQNNDRSRSSHSSESVKKHKRRHKVEEVVD
jgi:hypothetical protein